MYSLAWLVWTFFIGIIVGSIIGTVITSLCVAAKEADEARESLTIPQHTALPTFRGQKLDIKNYPVFPPDSDFEPMG